MNFSLSVFIVSSAFGRRPPKTNILMSYHRDSFRVSPLVCGCLSLSLSFVVSTVSGGVCAISLHLLDLSSRRLLEIVHWAKRVAW